MQPMIHINYMAVAAAVVINFIFGWIYYGPLLGKIWAKEMGFNMDQKPAPGVMIRGMILMIVGTFLTVFVLQHMQSVWRPSTWGLSPDQSDFHYGFGAGFFTWLGFFVPQQLGGVAWENKSWKLFGINAFYNFLSLQIVAMILAFWR
jgi:hypothetical protein